MAATARASRILIEAIVEIFRELELSGAPSFAYPLQYVCREHTIRIEADPARPSRRLDITVDGKLVTQTAFQRDLDTYLPNYVFAYYSGGAVGWSGTSTARPAGTTTVS